MVASPVTRRLAMPVRIGPSRREATLRPARWPGRPRGSAVLRGSLVAGLLLLATGVLYARDSPEPCDGPPSSPRSSGPAAEPGSTVGSPGVSGAPNGAIGLPPGTVGVPVRITEPATLAVVRPGGRVDLLAVAAGTGSGRPAEPTLLAARALVLQVIGAGAADGASGLYLALPPEQAHRAIGLPEGARFAIIVRP
jgi:hypothetical protein